MILSCKNNGERIIDDIHSIQIYKTLISFKYIENDSIDFNKNETSKKLIIPIDDIYAISDVDCDVSLIAHSSNRKKIILQKIIRNLI